MADETPSSTELSAAQREHLWNWVVRHVGGNPVCPICKSENWVVAEDLVAPVRMSPKGGYHFGGGAYPMAQLISVECGYTMVFNAVVVGLIEPKPVAAARDADPEGVAQ